jgi:Fe2+ transport system protein FeoA
MSSQPAPVLANPTPLSRLSPGEHGVVCAIDPGSPIGRRLIDLGFVPGTPICVVRRAPLGDPVAYELRGMRLCLRRSEAARISVWPTDDAGA